MDATIDAIISERTVPSALFGALLVTCGTAGDYNCTDCWLPVMNTESEHVHALLWLSHCADSVDDQCDVIEISDAVVSDTSDDFGLDHPVLFQITLPMTSGDVIASDSIVNRIKTTVLSDGKTVQPAGLEPVVATPRMQHSADTRIHRTMPAMRGGIDAMVSRRSL